MPEMDWERVTACLDDVIREKRENFSLELSGRNAPVDVEDAMKRFDVVLDEMLSTVKSSGPGYPYNMHYNDTGSWIRGHREQLRAWVRSRLERLSAFSWASIAELTPLERVNLGLCDYVRVFGKNEPHPKRKAHVRLIFGTAIVDQITMRLLFSWFSTKSVLSWKEGYFAPGLGFNDPGFSSLFDVFAKFKRATSVDSKSWDWHVTWYAMMCAAIVFAGTDPNATRWYIQMVIKMFILATNALCVLSDGRVYSFCAPGIMISGWYLTSHGNTVMAVVVAKYVTSPMAMAFAAGDDTVLDGVETSDSEIISGFREWGQIIKEVERLDGQVNFCSHTFDLRTRKVHFNGVVKTIYNYCATRPEERDPNALLSALRVSPEVERVYQILKDQSGTIWCKTDIELQRAAERWAQQN